ncbi:hypothetical protein RHD99_05380 [Buttiauxella selenatireducens]|uniref:Uncharacterized protein n=1 Tax=Buttiauxella selenatireducens TaxID=3073902 RepID=A0ABY9SD08_9ENTR|nr:hypothetical protein [Buttiauxella sp. R73]WMY75392.1 hypothetical protein RHD99_05380 [Buttiauxella sp. R73]
MKTTSVVQAVISFLYDKEAMLPEISAFMKMNPRECSNLLGTMLRDGTLIRTGVMRRYVYSLSPDRADPMAIYQARLSIVREKLAVVLRLMLKDIRILINETDWAARAFLDEALKNGDIYKHNKQGYFLNFADYEKYIEISSEKRLTKRRANCAAYREMQRALRAENLVNGAKSKPAEINIVCEECRQNWQGYQVHKIFGSGARA